MLLIDGGVINNIRADLVLDGFDIVMVLFSLMKKRLKRKEAAYRNHTTDMELIGQNKRSSNIQDTDI